MTFDINKAKKLEEGLKDKALKDVYGDLSPEFVHFLKNDVLNYCLQEYKTGIKAEHPVRIVNSWLAQDVIKIQSGDKGKIKRFNRLENIWLNIVFEARKFGIPISTLKETRKNLLESSIRDFSLFKLEVIKTLFSMPQIMYIPIEGQAKLYSFEAYKKWFSRGRFPVHAIFNLKDYISLEYPNNSLLTDFKIQNPLEDKNKMLLLYFLKTGDYQYLKFHLKEGDIRFIESSQSLLQNEEVMQSIINWNFQKVDIIINDELETSIKL
jgi:hypothetical protein